MAEALLSFGVERLWNLLVRECEQFQGVEEQFDGLKNDVEMLRCFLEDAEAKRHTSAMLPDETHFPAHLATVSLTKCRLKEDPMPILEKLLHLKIVRLWDRSFGGSRMICSMDGFPQLLELQFVGLEEWEEWTVEEGSMPLLHTLLIGYCPKLKELPDGLPFINSFKVLSFSLNAR
uniref:Disease resistance N-terminal domain-containing protein n=1 Tax=Brassica oleracea var. oleracea TaxID=109376 RepID=A0A0D3E5H8_BRAOL